MPLDFTGESTDTEFGVSLRALNRDRNQVIVIASHEAIQDHGLSEVHRVASEKYDNRKVDGNTVTVRNADFS